LSTNNGESLLARFRTGGTASNTAAVTTINTVDRPQGVTVNGALRAAQTMWLGQLTSTLSNATFLQKTTWQHTWKGKTVATESLGYAVQVYEVTSDGNAPSGPTG